MTMPTSNRMPLRLYLIRHGETEWSLSGQHSGRADICLTAHGEDEARAVGQRLRDVPFAHVLASPLRRAQQTCALAALGPRPKIEPDLAEWDNGDDEGRMSAEILKSRPDWNLFRDGSPNGETPAQIASSLISARSTEMLRCFPIATLVACSPLGGVDCPSRRRSVCC